jgi:hypothetical protein
LTSIFGILAVLFFAERPALSPNEISPSIQHIPTVTSGLLSPSFNEERSSADLSQQSFFVHVKSALSNRGFIILLCTFGIGFGLFSAVFTILGEAVTPPYSQTEAGWLGEY